MKLADAEYCHILDDNYEDALSLKNRYKILNANVFSLLTEKQQKFMLEIQDRFLPFYPKVQKNLDDVYPLFPEFFKLVSNFTTYTDEEIDGSNRLQLILSLCQQFVAPELTWAFGASHLCIRSLMHNPNRSEVQEQAFTEMQQGVKVGGIGITEPERGSDAVNMQTTASIDKEKGTITYNGVKIFTTNGAVADYFTAYGVLDISNPRETMMLTLFKREDLGVDSHRINIPAAEPGVGIARVYYKNVTVPIDRMVAPPGEGYRRLFRGLVPERLGIVGQALAYVWDALAQGTIYTQMRYQFGKPLFKYQGISHVLGDIYSKVAIQTSAAFNLADFYDNKILHLLHKGETPKPQDEGAAAFNAAQAKYLSCMLGPYAVYEIAQLMGGRGAIDETGSNNTICRLDKLARILEVTGGHRNVQMMIITGGLRSTSLPFIKENVKKAAIAYGGGQQAVVGAYLKRAQILMAEKADFLSEGTKGVLSKALTKFNVAMEEKNKIEIDAYGRAIPKMVIKAEREAKKAQKQ
jgi:alkylation response protein AidB-like acyl-CoA dehydrogenase